MKKKEIKIKPCPFCGSAAESYKDINPNEPDGWMVRCMKCPPGPWVVEIGKDKAIQEWNKRTKKSELRLYVFEGFSPSYQNRIGLAIAIANSKEDAMRQIRKAMKVPAGREINWGKMKSYPLGSRVAKFVVGGG